MPPPLPKVQTRLVHAVGSLRAAALIRENCADRDSLAAAEHAHAAALALLDDVNEDLAAWITASPARTSLEGEEAATYLDDPPDSS